MLFGSRLDDDAKGGNVDLLVEFSDPVDELAQMVVCCPVVCQSELRC